MWLDLGGSHSGSRPASRNADSKHGSIQSLDSYGTIPFDYDVITVLFHLCLSLYYFWRWWICAKNTYRNPPHSQFPTTRFCFSQSTGLVEHIASQEIDNSITGGDSCPSSKWIERIWCIAQSIWGFQWRWHKRGQPVSLKEKNCYNKLTSVS